MYPSSCCRQDSIAPAASITSRSFFSFEEDHSSTLSLLCFDGGLFINFDDILINYTDTMQAPINYTDTMQAPINNSDEGLIFMPDYFWDNPPIADDSTPVIAHHDTDEMADSHSMWDHWLNATCQPHPPHSSCCYDDSPSINGIPDHSSNTSMSPGNFTAGAFTVTPVTTYSIAGSPGTDKLNLQQSSSYFEACSASSYASPHQIDMEDCNNALEIHEIEDTKELAVAIQVKCCSPLLDDGYIWRKYGQKNIKGKSFPRSYYRCAEPLCPIKKQTEGSSEMEGYVVMTYFGKHNHS